MHRPTRSLAEMIQQRAHLLRQLRQFFDARGFLEVQPPCLARDCVVDPYIDPIEVHAQQLRLSIPLPDRLFLQTSPESAMKRMLAQGAPSIYSIGPVFRSGEQGPQHNVEFTMLEWYDVGARQEDEIRLLGQLAVEILGSDGVDVCDYRELFQNEFQLDPIDCELSLLRQHVAEHDPQLSTSIGDDRDAMLDILLSTRIQPGLGIDRPLIVKNYPLSQAALARVSSEDPQCAARFELMVGGVELANGYDELCDAEELLNRYQANNQRRRQSGRQPLDTETTLIQAMRDGLPQCSGVALGVDRLLMAGTGAKTLSDVMPFLVDNA